MADGRNEASTSTGSEDYLTQLLQEREKIDPQCKHTVRLLQQEIDRLLQPRNGVVKDSRKGMLPTPPMLEINTGRPCRVQVKVHVPVKDHPNFNFVGKLLGPKGSSLKQLQEVTHTKMAILGRGSVRDKQKEEEMRMECNPKYSHLQEDLHVEITAFATPAESYRRISAALTEVKQYLVPDYFDDIRQNQLRELAILNDKKSKNMTSESDVCSDMNSSLLVTTANPTVSSISTVPRPKISSQPYETLSKLHKSHILSNKYLVSSNKNLFPSATNGDDCDTGNLGRRTLRKSNVLLMENECEYEDMASFNKCLEEDVSGNMPYQEDSSFNYQSDFSGEQFIRTHKPLSRTSSSYRTTARFQSHPYNLNHTYLH